MTTTFGRARAVLLDLEGTLYAQGQLIPGASEAIAALRRSGMTIRFLTNIESRPAPAICQELAAIGLDVPIDELFTPLIAAATLFSHLGNAVVLPLVAAPVRASLGPLGEGQPPTHVLVGDCREILSYEVLDQAFRAIRDGAELLALQRGRYFLRPDGEHIDTGAIVAALEYAAGAQARVLGKPSRDFFDLAARSAGVTPAECVVVGDDATTDIDGGIAVGATTVQVRTGKFERQLAEDIRSCADITVDSIADLPPILGA